MKILNFRNTSALFLLLFSLFTVCRIFIRPVEHPFLSGLYNIPWLIYPGLLLIYIGVSVSMAFFPVSGFHYRDVKSHGDRTEKSLTLTFDDGPDTETTPLILDILRKYNIKATFFIIGRKIAGNDGILKRMLAEGHVIGNHSWSHTNLWDFYSSGRMADDIEKNIRETERITGKTMKLFRPPYGVINPMVARAIRKTAVEVVTWSFRSFDTVAGDPSSLLAKTINKSRPGDIMLFHDSLVLTAGILEKIIVTLQERGFSFISLEEMLKLKAYGNC